MAQISEQSIERIAKLLEEWPGKKAPPCFSEIAAVLGTTEQTASRAVKHLHAAGRVHLKWRYNGNAVAQVWIYGPGEDEVKRSPLSQKQYKENWQAANERERQRLAEARRPVQPFRHWQDEALFGAV